MGFPLINPANQFLDNSGNVLAGGKLFSYVVGTSTKKTTYNDADLDPSHANTNPIVLDSAGRCAVFLVDDEEYKFVLCPSTDTDPPTNPIWTRDNVKSPTDLSQATVGALLWPRTAAEIAAGVTPVSYAYEPGDIRRYGTNTTPGTTNMTTPIANALLVSATHRLVFQPETYLTGKQSLVTGSRIYMPPGCTLKDNGALGANDRFLNINTISNVHIVGWGAKVRATRADYVTGEQRHGVFVWNSRRVSIEGLEATGFGGDGYYVGGDSEVNEDAWPEDVFIIGGISDDSRRNGVSVTQGRHVWFIGHRSTNANGTSPQKGFDAEPNESDDTPGTMRGVMQDIHFLDCVSEGNLASAGFSFAGGNDTTTNPISVFFENCYSHGDAINFQVESSINNPGVISWKNCVGINSLGNGYEHKSNGMRVDIDGMTVIDCNQSSQASDRNGSSYSIFSVSGTDGTTYGRLKIRNSYALGTTARKVIVQQLVSEATSIIRDIDAEIWTDAAATKRAFYSVAGVANIAGKQRIVFTDDTQIATTGNITTSNMINYLWDLVTNTGASGALTLSLDDATRTRLPGIRVRAKVTAAHEIGLNAGTGWTIGGGSRLRSRTVGAEVTVESDGVGRWRIVEGGDGWGVDPIAFGTTDATPSVSGGTVFETADTTTITAFDDGVEGQKIIVLFKHAVTVDCTGTTLTGNGGSDISAASGDWLEAVNDGTNWRISFHDCTA